jgi:hypothetical protein
MELLLDFMPMGSNKTDRVPPQSIRGKQMTSSVLNTQWHLWPNFRSSYQFSLIDHYSNFQANSCDCCPPVSCHWYGYGESLTTIQYSVVKCIWHRTDTTRHVIWHCHVVSSMSLSISWNGCFPSPGDHWWVIRTVFPKFFGSFWMGNGLHQTIQLLSVFGWHRIDTTDMLSGTFCHNRFQHVHVVLSMSLLISWNSRFPSSGEHWRMHSVWQGYSNPCRYWPRVWVGMGMGTMDVTLQIPIPVRQVLRVWLSGGPFPHRDSRS